MGTPANRYISALRCLLFLGGVCALGSADAQNKQGLGPGGSRLTPPPAPSSGTGFGPSSGFGSSGSAGSSGGVPAGTRCVSIQCADGTVVPCDSSCPRPDASSSVPSGSGARTGGGYVAPRSIDSPSSAPGQTDSWRQEQARRDAEERQRREEFSRGRDQALRLLKGGETGELGIKGLGSDGELGLKSPGAETLRDAPSSGSKSQAASRCSANQDASVVDLCDRDIKKPIDPRTVKGKQRIPVSEKTLANENYIKGFDAIRASDYSLAVTLFKKARAQLGNDFLVKNALGLAEDLVKVRAKKKIILDPLTPGSATPGLLSGADHEKKIAEYEARKADVFRRMIEQSKLRDECRKQLPACSTDGKAYDKGEAIKRRDRQYFLWGEASYYVPWTDLLKDPPPEMTHEIGTLGAIKTWPYGGEQFYTWLKRDIIKYGSTPPGGEGYAKQGLEKAINDNQGLNP